MSGSPTPSQAVTGRLSRTQSAESFFSDSSTDYWDQLLDPAIKEAISEYVAVEDSTLEATQPITTPSVSADNSASASSARKGSNAPYYQAGASDLQWNMVDDSDEFDDVHLSGVKLGMSAKREKRKSDGDDTSGRPRKTSRRSRTTAASDTHASSAGTTTGVSTSSTDEPVVVVANSGPCTSFLHQARWGVQWEIARHVTTANGTARYSYCSVEFLRSLAGLSNHDGAQQVSTWASGLKLRNSGAEVPASDSEHKTRDTRAAPDPQAAERAAKDPWKALDEEQDYKDKLAADQILYLHDEKSDTKSKWFGGQVHFTAKLSAVKGSGSNSSKPEVSYHLELEKPSLGPSYALARSFGSDRFLRIRLAQNMKYTQDSGLIEYLSRPFVIGGHVFRSFYSRDHTVFLFRTNEIVIFQPDKSPPVRVMENPKVTTPQRRGQDGMGLRQFLEWFNNMSLDPAQSMAKWSARFALGLSSSVPGIRLHSDDIHFIDDIVSPAHIGKGKPPTELVMTDGCGFANRAFFEALPRDILEGGYIPTAVQVRVFGAKGLLMQHPEYMINDGKRPQIWLRPSQRKILHPEGTADPAFLTVDILRCSHPPSPATLSTETIINLGENGVPAQQFVSMMKDTLTERIDRLTTWEGEEGLSQLSYCLQQEGGVLSARRAREQVSKARARGDVFEDPTADDADDAEGGEEGERSTAWWWDFWSGCPSSLEEICLVLLGSGFTPSESPVLCARLSEVAKKALKFSLNKFRVDVPKSCSAWAVPDPCGVLEPGEIYIESSVKNLIDQQGRSTDMVLGEVLVTRHPCKLPTDVQRAQAVDRHQLHGIRDVVIVSTKGHKVSDEWGFLDRHLLSMTGGGDYDGDRVQVFWEHALVKGFTSADPKYATEPASVAGCLQRSDEKVGAFQERMEGEVESVRLAAAQKYLLGGLRDTSAVGKYSTFWEVAMYMRGYDHEETIRLAHLFCAILDGSKTGVTVSPQQRYNDEGKYGKSLKWKEPIYGGQDDKSRIPPPVALRTKSEEFIMVVIRSALKKISDELGSKIGQRLSLSDGRRQIVPDPDLAEPWEDYVRRATKNVTKRPFMLELAKVIEDQVADLYKEKPKTETALPIQERQDKLRAHSKAFHAAVARIAQEYDEYDQETLTRYMASCAYLHDHRENRIHWSRWPWNVAMGALCGIKARAKGYPITMIWDHYSRSFISKKAVGL